MSFLTSLSSGLKGESLVHSLFKECNIICVFNKHTKNLSEFDIICVSKQIDIFTVEIKNDRYATKSGNIAIETYNPKSGKDSGLMATKADVWIHIADNGVYCCSIKALKKLIESIPPVRIIRKAGDGNATIYLYAMMPDIFYRLDDITPQERIQVLKKCLK